MPSGEPVLLLDQNRARWDQLLIRRGLAALDQARRKRASGQQPGSYALQAAIAACHARARAPRTRPTGARIVGLYGALAELTPSPVVELNRAVALVVRVRSGGRTATGRCAGAEPALKNYHLLPGVRGDLLVKLGRHEEARGEFERAASLTRNERERALLLKRAAECEAKA